MVYIVIEKEPPFGISTFIASSDYMDLGSFEYRKTLQEFQYCLKHNYFHQSYNFRSVNHFVLDVPGWAKKT